MQLRMVNLSVVSSPGLIPEYLRERYSLKKVCEILDCDEVTLRRWLREGGVPLEDGRRVKISFIPLGVRNKVFLKEEIDRVWRELKAAGEEIAMADVLDFPAEDERRGQAQHSESGHERRRGVDRRVS
jgi:transposase-like protein